MFEVETRKIRAFDVSCEAEEILIFTSFSTNGLRAKLRY